MLLHDSIGCVALWRDWPEKLCTATSRTVIAYDRLGFGRSDPHPGLLAPDFITAECARSLPPILDALGVQEFILFGHSVGGGMAIAGAVAFGARCRALITVAAQTLAESQTFEGVRAARTLFAPDTPQYQRLIAYHGAKTDWVLGAWIDTWLSPAFQTFSLADVIHRVRCPVLAIHGTRDEYGSPAHARMIEDLASGPVTLSLLECGHVPHREQPDAVLRALDAFFVVAFAND